MGDGQQGAESTTGQQLTAPLPFRPGWHTWVHLAPAAALESSFFLEKKPLAMLSPLNWYIT